MVKLPLRTSSPELARMSNRRSAAAEVQQQKSSWNILICTVQVILLCYFVLVLMFKG